MFVRDFLHVDEPFEVVAPRFVTDASWLAPIAEHAGTVASALALTLVGAAPGDRPRGTEPRCHIGPARARASSLLVPVWLWGGGRDERGLPDLSGDLEVAPVGASQSLLAFGATYRRPDRDATTAERATEAAVRTFLNGIAGELTRP